MARSSYLHLKNISRIRPFLTFDSAKTLTVSLIHSRLDYCNSLLIGLPLTKLSPLQSVLNAAARIIFLTNRYTDASTLCQSLHWLPIHSRIQYKTTTLIHKALHGSAPPYISSLVSVYHPTRALRSADDLSIFRKETAVNSLLHATSSHPRPLISSIPIGQFLRVRRICSDDGHFFEQAAALATRFQDRGYSNRSIKRGLKRAEKANRTDLLKPRNKTTFDTKIRFITTYNQNWKDMSAALTKYWPLLRVDHTLAKHLPDRPSITYRKSPNLKDQLVRSYYSGTTPEKAFSSKGPKWGFYPCGNCIACPNMVRATAFKSWDGRTTFSITQHITCDTIGVVYYISCPCSKIYVGLTLRPLKTRIREHYRDIINAQGIEDLAILKPVPRHFKVAHGCDASLLKAFGIDKIHIDARGGNWRKSLVQLEARWIHRIGSVQPYGLNEILSFAPFL
ncbi:unnamed protein product [Ranitomeya imitator]|uniref:Helix-turn-helix domain-containing protein n=1 Tax=Ranitomeya imitator TaxID=111125 RepID=A0ABN9LBU5_9NEOB|nr:unnamed protein product [Ranitomeya imitator]